MDKKLKYNVSQMAQMAMLSAVSIVSLYVIPLLSFFPSAPFLQYDVADVPVLIGTMLFGPGSGLLILGVVSVIQGITISAASGWIGIVMHFCASGMLVLISGLLYRKFQTVTTMIIGLVLGALAMTGIMIPLNLFFTVRFMGAPYPFVKSLLLPAIIPFNLLKAGLNSIFAGILFYPLKSILVKLDLLQPPRCKLKKK